MLVNSRVLPAALLREGRGRSEGAFLQTGDRRIESRGRTRASIVLENVLEKVDRGIEIARGRGNQFWGKLIWDIDPMQS